jgi:hypothetical protein
MKSLTKKIVWVLMVVILISIFSTVVTAGFPVDRKKGRDAKRVSELKQLQAALKVYANECGGFPDVPTSTIIGSPGFETSFREGCPEGITMSRYIATFPINPLPGSSKWDKFVSYILNRPVPGDEPYTYCSTAFVDSLECSSSRQSYMIHFSLEVGAGGFSKGSHFITPKEVR